MNKFDKNSSQSIQNSQLKKDSYPTNRNLINFETNKNEDVNKQARKALVQMMAKHLKHKDKTIRRLGGKLIRSRK